MALEHLDMEKMTKHCPHDKDSYTKRHMEQISEYFLPMLTTRGVTEEVLKSPGLP